MQVAETLLQRALELDSSLIEPKLTFVSRETSPDGTRHYRIDLVYRDSQGRDLLVELKRGAITKPDVDQIVRYLEMWLKRKNGKRLPVRTMLIGTSISPALLEALYSRGIECKVLSKEIIDRIAFDSEKKRPKTPPRSRKRTPSGRAVISFGGKTIGPTTFPDAMRQLYCSLIMDMKIEPEALISCSNPGGAQRKTRLEIQSSRKTRDSFAAVAADDLCAKNKFEIFHVGNKTFGLTTKWADGGSRRVIREINEKFPQLRILLSIQQ